MAEEAAVKVKGLYKLYHVGEETVRALNGVDFEIKKGEFCSIVGASGSGKSTLLNMLAGLEKPTKGEIIIAGEHIEKKRENQLVRFRREHIGFIFQSFNLMGTMNAIENVALPLNFQGMNRTLRRKKAEKALKLVGLQKYMKHRPTQMSGGQQQRVGVARALVMQPEIIFADEPTGNLDSKTSREVMELMQKIVRKRHQTLVMVTHDNYLAGFADRIIHIMDGKVVKVEENHNPQGILANGGEASKEDAPVQNESAQNAHAQSESAENEHAQSESAENAQAQNVSGQAAAENAPGQTGQADNGASNTTG